MGLFKGWFSKGGDDDARSFHDWRREERRRISTVWPAVEARIGDARGQVLDLSESGFCLAIDEKHAPERELVTIAQGDEVLAKGFALRVWRGGSRVGYNFATGLSVEQVQQRRAATAAADTAERMPTRADARRAILQAGRPAPQDQQKAEAAEHKAEEAEFRAEEAERKAEAALEALEALETKLNSERRELAVPFPNDAELRAIQTPKGEPSATSSRVAEEPLPFQAARRVGEPSGELDQEFDQELDQRLEQDLEADIEPALETELSAASEWDPTAPLDHEAAEPQKSPSLSPNALRQRLRG